MYKWSINTPLSHNRDASWMTLLIVILTDTFYSFLPLALRRLTAQHSWLGGLQQQQLSKGGPQTYQITLTPPPRMAFQQLIRSFLGHRYAQQAGCRSIDKLQLCSFPILCTTGKRQAGRRWKWACTCSDSSLTCLLFCWWVTGTP